MTRGEELTLPKQDTFLDLKILHHIEGETHFVSWTMSSDTPSIDFELWASLQLSLISQKLLLPILLSAHQLHMGKPRKDLSQYAFYSSLMSISLYDILMINVQFLFHLPFKVI